MKIPDADVVEVVDIDSDKVIIFENGKVKVRNNYKYLI